MAFFALSFFHVSLLILLLFLSPLLSEEAPLEVIGKPKNDPSLTGSTREDPSGFTEIIKKENFKGRYLSLSEVLEKETGVRIKRYGGLGSYSTLSIRGSNANQVKIYIDGIPLNNSEGGEVNLSDLSFDNLERIEIHKSGMTPGLSSSAIGGSINLITNGKPLKRKTRVSARTPEDSSNRRPNRSGPTPRLRAARTLKQTGSLTTSRATAGGSAARR